MGVLIGTFGKVEADSEGSFFARTAVFFLGRAGARVFVGLFSLTELAEGDVLVSTCLVAAG